MENNYKFEVGQKVIYRGLVGVIEDRCTYTNGSFGYSLVAELDSEMTCTAKEEECEMYVDQEIDQEENMMRAQMESRRIMGMVDGITDKYIGDCSFNY